VTLAGCYKGPIVSAKRPPALGYPACVFTTGELQRVAAAGGDMLHHFNYTVPPACAAVLQGRARGGVDAAPVTEE
jgi:hypothetical protein